jgi:hemoglobin
MVPPTAISALTDDITTVVDAFYVKVRRDPVLGPVFARAIADDAWPAHLAIIQISGRVLC